MEWKQNIIEDFKQLVSFDSISFHERNTADWLLARLKSMGFSVEEDQAGAYYGGDTGNIFAVNHQRGSNAICKIPPCCFCSTSNRRKQQHQC